MPLTLRLILTLLLGLTGFTATSADTDALINACNECHAPDKIDVPVISGVSAFALEDALLGYGNGARKPRKFEDKDMKTELEKLSEAQIKTLIEHYAALKFTPIKQAFDASLAAQGAKLHATHCEKCHTENGAVADDDSGILAGQWKGYLREEMKQYRNGGRTGDKKMIRVFNAMSDEQITALAEFYASQH